MLPQSRASSLGGTLHPRTRTLTTGQLASIAVPMPDLPNIDLLLYIQVKLTHLRNAGLTLAKGHVHSYLTTIES